MSHLLAMPKTPHCAGITTALRLQRMTLDPRRSVLQGPRVRGACEVRMPRLVQRIVLPVMTVCALTGCEESCPTKPCTAGWVPGIWVSVLDAESGAPIACGAVAWVTDGAYTDTLRTSDCTLPDSLRSGGMSGGDDRPGIYDVHVERAGYHPWDRAGVHVIRRRCDCHVQRVTLEARLEPL